MRGSSRKNHARIIKKDLGWQQYVQTQLDDINDELLLLYEKSTAYASKPDDPPKMRLVEATENGTGNKVVMVRLLANFKFSCDTLTESDKKFINEAVQNLRDLLSNEGEFDLESDGCQIIKPIRWVISSFYVLLSAPVVVLDRLYKSLQEERESDSLLQFDIADVYPAFRVTTSDVAASLSRTLARLALRQEALAIKARSSLGQGEAELTFKVRLDTTDKHAESSLLHFVSAEQRRTIAADKELEITDLAALRLVALNGKPRFGATEGHKNITPSANVFDTPKFRRSCEARGWSLDKGKNHVCSKWNTFNGGDGLAFPCDKHGSFVQNLSQERLWDPAKWLEESAPKSLKQEVKAAQTATPVTSGKKEKRKKNKTAAAAGPAIAQAWLDHRKSWRSTDQKGLDHSKLFAVSPKSAEFNGVATEFARTLPYCTIDQLDRVENGYAQEAFELNCATIERQVGAAYDRAKMRRMLFHGTDAVEMIVNSTDGHSFLPLLAGTAVGAIWGDGTYFARDAKYSHNYARALPNGQRQMLVVEVAVGRWAQGKPGLKSYPVIPGEKYTRHNSLVDDPGNPSIFVVQHSSQAYPAYLITYH